MKQYENVVIGVDLDEPSTSLLEQARLFANHEHANYHLVCVYPNISMTVPFEDGYATEFSADVLNELKQKMLELKTNLSGVSVSTHIKKGKPSVQIVKLANTLKADLIVVGSHGKHGLNLLLGSTANGVLHHTECDVLTVRVDGSGKHISKGQYRTVLLATDFGEHSEKVIELAKQFCDDVGATLHVLSVVSELATLATLYDAQNVGVERTNVQEKMSILTESLSLDVTHANVVTGIPINEILAYANKINADLIILGTHGKKVVASALLGSTTHAILHNAKVDVFLSRI